MSRYTKDHAFIDLGTQIKGLPAQHPSGWHMGVRAQRVMDCGLEESDFRFDDPDNLVRLDKTISRLSKCIERFRDTYESKESVCTFIRSGDWGYATVYRELQVYCGYLQPGQS